MAYLVQTLASGLDLTGHAHLVLHNDGLLVSSPARHCIYYVENGVATVWAGSDGVSGSVNGSRLSARFNTPCGLAKDNSGNIYLSDSSNHVIRKIDALGNVSVVAGSLGVSGTSGDNAQATSALLDSPTGLSVSLCDQGSGVFTALFVLCANRRVRYLNLNNGNIYLALNQVSGVPTGYISAFYRKPNIYYPNTTILFISSDFTLYGRDVFQYLGIDKNGIIHFNSAYQYNGISFPYPKSTAQVGIDADYYLPKHYGTASNTIFRVGDPAGGYWNKTYSLIAGTGVAGFNGDGEALQTKINNPTFIFNDNTGIYFIDSGNGRIRKIIQSEIAYFDPPTYLLQSNLVSTSIIKQSPTGLTLLSEHNFQGGVLESIQFNYDVQFGEINHISKVNQAAVDLLIQGFTTDLKVSFYFEPIILNLSQEIIPIVGAFEFVAPTTYELGNDLAGDFNGDYDLIKSEEIISGYYDLIQSKEIIASYDITEFNQLDSTYDLIEKQDIDIIYSREKYKDFSVRYTHTGIVFSTKEAPLRFNLVFSTKELPLIGMVFSTKEIALESYSRVFSSKETPLSFTPVFSTKEMPLNSIVFSSKGIPLSSFTRVFSTKETPLRFTPTFSTKELPLLSVAFSTKEIPLESYTRVFSSAEYQTKVYYRQFSTKEILTVIPDVQHLFFTKEIPLIVNESAGTTVIDSSDEHFWLEHNNTAIIISKYDISISASDAAWKGQVEINTESDYFKLNIGDTVYLHIPNQVFKLVVISKNVSKQGLQKRTFNASLESPVSLLNNAKTSLTFGNDTASNIANQIYETEWDLTDWVIPSGSLMVNEGTPLNLLKQLSECVGGIITSKQDGSLLARSKFKFSVNKWDNFTPEFSISQNLIFSESLTSQAVKRWDSVIASSGESREINYAVETIEVDKQKYLICRPSIWRDDIYLFHTSKYPTGIRYIGALEETIEEQIEIKEGKASISKPVSELIEYNYHWKDLGLLEIIDNELVLVNMPENKLDAYSLVKVKYKTKFHKWAVGGGEGDTAQFVFVAEKEF